MLGWVVGGLVGLLFRLGSLLYLTATAILCLDVIILHRCLYMHYLGVAFALCCRLRVLPAELPW